MWEGGGGNGKKVRVQGWSGTETILDRSKNRMFAFSFALWLASCRFRYQAFNREREAALTQYVADGAGGSC